MREHVSWRSKSLDTMLYSAPDLYLRAISPLRTTFPLPAPLGPRVLRPPTDGPSPLPTEEQPVLSMGQDAPIRQDEAAQSAALVVPPADHAARTRRTCARSV